MKIGVDIDGVLTDIASFLFDHSIEFFRSRGIELVNPKGYDVKGMYEVEDKLIGDFWLEYLSKYFSSPARYKASEVLNKLQKEEEKRIKRNMIQFCVPIFIFFLSLVFWYIFNRKRN